MPICQRRKLALIHIPKTAGSSFTDLLDLRHEENFFAPEYDAYTFDGVTYAPQHLTPALLAQLVPGFEDYTKICFTRHPYQKVVSEYFWLKKDFDKRPVRFYRESNLRRWIDEVLRTKDMDHKLDQYLYAKDCDHVFPLHLLRQNLPQIEEILGVKIENNLQHHKKSKRDTKKIAASLSDETKDLIYQIYPDDFEPLGYQR